MLAFIYVILLTGQEVFCRLDNATGGLDDGMASQYFIEKPDFINMVDAGEDFSLKCKIGNLAGQVQWTKNGIAMGYKADQIKNFCSKCSLYGDAQQGEYHLLVKNIRKYAVYECQVSPGGENHKALRAVAQIKVRDRTIVPPSSLEMNPKGSLDVVSGTPRHISCIAKGSFPKAKIVWYHRGRKMLDLEYEERVSQGEKDGTLNTESEIVFNPSSRDNRTQLSCVVEHRLIEKHAMRRDICLNVVYLPGEPEIAEVEVAGEWRVGDRIETMCEIQEENPRPEVHSFKNSTIMIAISVLIINILVTATYIEIQN